MDWELSNSTFGTIKPVLYIMKVFLLCPLYRMIIKRGSAIDHCTIIIIVIITVQLAIVLFILNRCPNLLKVFLTNTLFYLLTIHSLLLVEDLLSFITGNKQLLTIRYTVEPHYNQCGHHWD